MIQSWSEENIIPKSPLIFLSQTSAISSQEHQSQSMSAEYLHEVIAGTKIIKDCYESAKASYMK